ncbi:MAG: DUF1178 family protein [Pseudomonadota bacterium]
MISFTLKCKNGHQFDSWFASSAAFDALEKAGHLSCALCGSAEVSKSLMAPRVSARDADETTVPVLSEPQSEAEKAIEEMRRKVEENADYVGRDFVDQARAMHEGTAQKRGIWGEARLDQARELAQKGVPVMPLPFGPKQKLT